jgi:hypothetical protein
MTVISVRYKSHTQATNSLCYIFINMSSFLVRAWERRRYVTLGICITNELLYGTLRRVMELSLYEHRQDRITLDKTYFLL